MYFCTGRGMHAPHQVPQEWVDKYKGQFDEGWDAYREKVFAAAEAARAVARRTRALSPRDPDVAAWDTLSADEKRLYARMMEVFAGFLEHTDHHIGRLIDFLERTGQLDNTLIMVVSDNGASAEGGPHGSINENLFFNNVPETLEDDLAAIDELGGPKYFNHYPWGWAWAGNTPFRRWKRETYRGGVADPFIVHWPARHQGQGRGAHAIRARHRHGADGARGARHRAAAADPGRDAVADRGRLVRAQRSTTQGREPPPHPVLRDDGRTARSITTAGARCVRCRGRRSPRRAWASARWS